MSGVIVANPGSVPEMPAIARGLAAIDRLDSYISPLAFTTNKIQKARQLPYVGPLLAKEMSRRPLPIDSMGRRRVWGATALELAVVTAQRAPRPLSRALENRLIWARNSIFDHGVAAVLDSNVTGLVCGYSAATASLARAALLGIETFLEYPIAHHRYAARLLEAEAQLQPDFAGSLQFHRLAPNLVARMDRELDLADHIFALSTFHAETFLDAGIPPEKLLPTPLGVDLELFRPSHQADRPGFRVLFVGQLTQRKGLSYLLDAFRAVAKADWELWLVGRPVGDIERHLRRDSRIRQIAHMPRFQLPGVYHAADVFVLPSLIEGFPQTALEAMACGVPVIVSQHTFATDVVTDGVDGFVVPIRDSTSIADRLMWFAEDPWRRRRIGSKAAERAKDFSWSRYAKTAAAHICGPSDGG